MIKFKAGDWVRIKSDTRNIAPSYSLLLNSKMDQYFGNVYRIKAIDRNFDDTAFYILEDVFDEDDDYYWIWDQNWLEPEEISNIAAINDDDVLGVLNND